MKLYQIFCLGILLLISSSSVIAQDTKPVLNGYLPEKESNSVQSKNLKEFIKNEKTEFEPEKEVSPTTKVKNEESKEPVKKEKEPSEPKPKKKDNR